MNLPRLSDIMTRDPVSVSPSDTLRVVLERMRQRNCRRLPVVEGGKLVGIVSDRDVRLALNSPFILRERREDETLLERVVVAECMTPDPVTLPPDASVLDAARLIHERKFGGIPIVDAGKLVGIVTETDLLACFTELLGKQNQDFG
ncbi:MAG TPA: CBS domain-containing protein [Anaerolineae bacterium]|nr:CBS domain-containing protein [Anaerolineae bacterium]